MDIRKLQRAIVDGLEDVKAQDIRVFNTEALSPLFERVIIASGTSNRQTKALASSVREAVKACGLPVLRTEGEENGEWIIVDCGAAVAHIMQPSIRDYYHLEEIWGGKPVRLKREAVATGLPKASDEPMPASAAAKGAGKPGPRTRKVSGADVPSAAESAGSPAPRPPARKRPPRVADAAPASATTARKAAPRKSSSAADTSTGVRRASASASTAVPARKPASRKTGTATPTARKTAPRAARKTTPKAG